jgi:acyl carrier protein
VDAEFRALLLERRAGAAAEIGLELAPAEKALVNTVPTAQLDAVISRTRVPDEHRRAFLGRAAAAMLAAVAAMTPGSTCAGFVTRSRQGGAASGGIRSDRPSDRTGAHAANNGESAPGRTELVARPGSVEDRVLTLLARRFKVDKKSLHRETSFTADLKAQPADLVKLKAELEKEFGVKIPGKAYKSIRTVGQAMEYIQREVARQPQTGAPTSSRPDPSRGTPPDRSQTYRGGMFGNRPDAGEKK